MDNHKIQDMSLRVHIVCSRTNVHNFNNLSMDEQGEMCVRIARAILITQEDMQNEDNNRD